MQDITIDNNINKDIDSRFISLEQKLDLIYNEMKMNSLTIKALTDKIEYVTMLTLVLGRKMNCISEETLQYFAKDSKYNTKDIEIEYELYETLKLED